IAPARLSLGAFSISFQVLLGIAWGGYAVAVIAGFKGRLPAFRVLVAIVGAIGLLTALFCPPSLSFDSYLYLAYARMQLAHGINPVFVMEGPGNGHNDLLMLALLLLGVLLCLRAGGGGQAVGLPAQAGQPEHPIGGQAGQPAPHLSFFAGILLLGLSVGIKFI